MRLRYLFLILFALIPIAAHAQGVFTVPTTDKSMQYLASIFGSMGTLPIQVSGEEVGGETVYNVSTIFRTLVERFNIIVFTLGLIIIAWTTMVSTISTAQEGEVMGKKFSSIWIPARMGFGMYFLLPSGGAGGYSLIQTAVMWMVVQGVGAANAIWKEIVTAPDAIHEDTRAPALANQEAIIAQLFKSATCMARINYDTGLLNQTSGESITMFRDGDTIKVGLISASGSTEEMDLAKASVCGTFEIPSTATSPVDSSGYELDIESRKTILADAIAQAFMAMSPAAIEAVFYEQNKAYASGPITAANTLVTAARVLNASMDSLKVTRNYEAETERAILQG